MAEELHPDNLNLRSEEVQEILSNPPAWIVRWGITLIFMFTVIILVLSFIIKYPDFVTAKVIVTTEAPAEKIIAKKSGQLEGIFIKNRDTVVIKQRLAIIKNTADFNDVYYLKGLMDTIVFNAQDLSFPIKQSANLILGDIETAYINFEKSYLDYFLLKDLEPYTNLLIGNRQSLSEIKKRLLDHINQKQLLEQEYDLKQTDLEREYASENGTELSALLPKMSRLNPQYLTKKQSVFQKISLFVEKFKGVGGSI